MAQDRVKCWAFMIILCLPKNWEFIYQMDKYNLLKEESVSWRRHDI
jgi:hypothetical protein